MAEHEIVIVLDQDDEVADEDDEVEDDYQ